MGEKVDLKKKFGNQTKKYPSQEGQRWIMNPKRGNQPGLEEQNQAQSTTEIISNRFTFV